MPRAEVTGAGSESPLAAGGPSTPPIFSNGHPVYGSAVDAQTRCVHWHGETDVVALKFLCCDRYYPCFDCHEEDAHRGEGAHESSRWPVARWDEPTAVLCGVCGTELSVNAYLATEDCPSCTAVFNPGCALHAHLYFETPQRTR
ncbi:CHY zinc finger protein [Glaciihabitans sp. dw_435]|uniref:CHY zinc finger protein n=1 Tax=Glaciihabitans sp. dw_435 TaxID=2720081 RepID=UPI001BD43416|nr:CHY zinc finger protein [Glaciihabitans sp. dw_435]